MACVKADGYGHGLSVAADALENCVDGFAVACMEEALALRKEHADKPLLVLEGLQSADEIELAITQNIALCICAEHQLRWLESHPGARRPRCWLKVDTGMHRMGLQPGDTPAAYSQLRSLVPPSSEIVLCTHFARADERGDNGCAEQLRRFDQAVSGISEPQSCANSAAILSLPAVARSWVRPGYMLYGGSPFADTTPAQLNLLPGMEFSARVINLHTVAAGERVGYGGRWQANRETRIATIAAGYGDGYPRLAPDGTPVLIEGKRLPLAGRVSMDMLTVDVSEHPSVRIGSEAVLWGADPGVDEIAHHVGTIGYELLAALPQRALREVHYGPMRSAPSSTATAVQRTSTK